jgi:molecular chaperone DnaK (HSP70)
MKYVGIDLGTTNSAICSFDGVNRPGFCGGSTL